jgi:hypothetical protein
VNDRNKKYAIEKWMEDVSEFEKQKQVDLYKAKVNLVTSLLKNASNPYICYWLLKTHEKTIDAIKTAPPPIHPKHFQEGGGIIK